MSEVERTLLAVSSLLGRTQGMIMEDVYARHSTTRRRIVYYLANLTKAAEKLNKIIDLKSQRQS